MIGLFFGTALRGAMFGPVASIVGVIVALFAICGCVRCLHCHVRDCPCFKRCLRCLGVDQFDEFELMILVHEVMFEHKDKLATVVRVTAGPHTVSTEPNTHGIFQQALHVTVEQGTSHVIVELLDNHGRKLANLKLDTVQNLLNPQALQPELVLNMKQKAKGVINPKIKLTMVVSSESDAEAGLLSGAGDSDVQMLVRQQLRKAKDAGKTGGDEECTEIEVLQRACCGPLEVFEGLGKTNAVYAAVVGPPTSRRWLLGLWPDQHSFEKGSPPKLEVDLLKAQCVQGDPTRHHVFIIHYFDDSRVRQTLTFRRVDRARGVWVEILLLLCHKAREAHKEKRKTMSDTRSQAGSRDGSLSAGGKSQSFYAATSTEKKKSRSFFRSKSR